MQRLYRIRWIILLCLLVACYDVKPEKETLTIATAANMQFAMQEIAHQFTTKTNIPCELVVSSSGKLTAQIKQGAPFHIFVAANLKYPQEIFDSGLALQAPKVYAYGKLVLWTMKEEFSPSLKAFVAEKGKHIALANPQTAPYGMAAMEVLKNKQLDKVLGDKLVFGESVAQTNQFIIAEAADIGFTSMAVVLSPHLQKQGNWVEIDSLLYTPIQQAMVVVKGSEEEQKVAMQFYNFVFSTEAREILRNFGYSVD